MEQTEKLLPQPDQAVSMHLLSSLAPGQRARVSHLSPACTGAERRRMLDLGFVSDTIVEVDMRSPGGDPTAYRVRGTLIALRREQASLIYVKDL